MKSPIAVIGGTGGVGRLVTRKLMARGETVRVIGRATLRARRHLPPLAQFFLGDVREPETLRTPLYGCGAVVYVMEPGPGSRGSGGPAGTPESGVVNTLDTLLRGAVSGGPRFVLVSRPDSPGPTQERLTGRPPAGEDAVRASGLPYTVVRPGLRTEHDIAEACVQALFGGPGTRRPAPERALA
ncbi:MULTISPECIES: NAD(P)H-binding protein [unclassified Streptomyces]|uniref:SDR family oxidoreductase n=1 Tax=unclassified Streptomyces TaxID=2593676 RepID=UPI002E80DEC5|nr:NAD(P)H-binding protein [Streptomyces sp. NBC_00589]WTI36306.1 NAD(P)H-binding protein [Streptomyces sp. NBC_00775]WUB30019.1 NAD(P)H-binding protein [Streptomyces sp. NBC_00589]